jgi:V/A-type H+/Na+-transporting ATPase subunit I
MIKAEAMTKVSIVCPKTYLEKVITSLYELGACHIEQHRKSEEIDIGKPLEKSEKLAEILVKIRALISQLDLEKDKVSVTRKNLQGTNYYEIGKQARHIYNQVVEYTETIKDTSDKIAELEEKSHVLEILRSLHISKQLLQESKHLAHLIGSVDLPCNLDELRKELNKVTKEYEIVMHKQEAGRKMLIAIYMHKEQRAGLSEILASHGFSEVNITPALESKRKITEQIHDLHTELTRLSQQRNKAQAHLNKLKRENVHFLVENEHILTEETRKAEVPLQFGETKKAFTIKGWIPTARMNKVKAELDAITQGNIHIIEEEPGKKDTVPVKLKNNFLVKPYEFFLKLYELPNYKEFDPSILMFITFPLFFGFMLVDVGYGIATLILFSLLKLKFPTAKALLNIMIFASIVTIVFGVGFGEYFGFEHVSFETGKSLCESTGVCLAIHEVEIHGITQKVADFPRVFNRVHSHMNIGDFKVLSVLVIGAIAGFIHLNIALLIGFFNILVTHGFMHAFLEKISWMVMQAGVIVVAMAYSGATPLTPLTGFVLIIMGIVMIYLGEGAKGLVEVPAIFSNMLSYMRLGAVGLASVGLAVVVNENLAMPFIEKGGFYIFLAIIILTIGHIINIGLGILGPFLHSLRLHYVEFFSKFYQGGGKPYQPFGPREEDE